VLTNRAKYATGVVVHFIDQELLECRLLNQQPTCVDCWKAAKINQKKLERAASVGLSSSAPVQASTAAQGQSASAVRPQQALARSKIAGDGTDQSSAPNSEKDDGVDMILDDHDTIAEITNLLETPLSPLQSPRVSARAPADVVAAPDADAAITDLIADLLSAPMSLASELKLTDICCAERAKQIQTIHLQPLVCLMSTCRRKRRRQMLLLHRRRSRSHSRIDRRRQLLAQRANWCVGEIVFACVLTCLCVSGAICV
jgi:hypothetical protein